MTMGHVQPVTVTVLQWPSKQFEEFTSTIKGQQFLQPVSV